MSAVETGDPLAGAFVVLLDGVGDRSAAALTGRDGAFRVRVEAPGVYRLRVELLGYATHEEEVRELVTAEVVVRNIRMRIAPLMLEGITATGESRCGIGSDAATEVHRVWEEARKALAIADWLSASGHLVHQVELFERTRDVVSDALRDEPPHWRRQRSATGKVPFRTAPVDALAERGYVQATGEGAYEYFGVDAAVLLSDAFLETHCFRVIRADDGTSRIGLAFSPLPGRSLPDVEGVIWLDADTFGPLHVEYTFTRHLHAFDIPDVRFGGRTEFEPLENGAWVTSRWLLRMPDFIESTAPPPSFLQPRSRQSGGRTRLLAARDEGLVVNEQGGDLVFVRVPTGATGTGEVEGVVWDSTRSLPLAGATVFAANGESTAVTDASGRFRLTGLPVGSNTIGFFHPYADSIAFRGHMVDVEVGATRALVALGIPAEAFCSLEKLSFLTDDALTLEIPSSGIVGFAEDARTGLPLAGAQIEAEWEVRGRWRLRDALRGIGPDKPRGDHIVTDANGRFLICAVPVGSALRIRAAGGRRVSIEVDRRLLHANVVVR